MSFLLSWKDLNISFAVQLAIDLTFSYSGQFLNLLVVDLCCCCCFPARDSFCVLWHPDFLLGTTCAIFVTSGVFMGMGTRLRSVSHFILFPATGIDPEMG